MTHIGRERGWPPTTRAQFDAGLQLRGISRSAAPQQVIEKILFQHEALGHQRYLMQMSVGTMPHAQDHAVDRAVRHEGRARGAQRAQKFLAAGTLRCRSMGATSALHPGSQ